MKTAAMSTDTSDSVAMGIPDNVHVKAEPPVPSIAAPAPTAEREDTSATEADINTKKRGASVKQLKLRLFQQLARRQQHTHAWPQYWRALQQFLLARLSVDEFHCIVHILLGPDLLEPHNAFIVAILNEAQTNSAAADRDSDDDKAAALRGEGGDKDGSDLKAQVEKEALSTPTNTLPVKNEVDPNGDLSQTKADRHEHSTSSEKKKRQFSTHISSPDDEREYFGLYEDCQANAYNCGCLWRRVYSVAVKKLLHFANSKRDTPEKQHSDQQSAELLIGLGNFGSRATSNKSSSSASSQ